MSGGIITYQEVARSSTPVLFFELLMGENRGYQRGVGEAVEQDWHL